MVEELYRKKIVSPRASSHCVLKTHISVVVGGTLLLMRQEASFMRNKDLGLKFPSRVTMFSRVLRLALVFH